ncbi:hypothetical protein B566_EDAN012462 [Ephemera danica]|nr:hypothetical protein B566_EDAN012462 [Ephemera danica]
MHGPDGTGSTTEQDSASAAMLSGRLSIPADLTIAEVGGGSIPYSSYVPLGLECIGLETDHLIAVLKRNTVYDLQL